MSSKKNSYVKEKRFSNPGKAKAIIQRLGRGVMLPIAILPIAGLLLGVGAGINNALVAAHVTSQNAFIFGNVMKSVGDVIFGNLPVLFAIAIAITFTDDAGVAALAAFVAMIVFNAVQAPFIKNIIDIDGNITSLHVAWYDNVSVALVTQNLGITSLNTSVFGGIIIGSVVAILYNKFYKIKLPTVIGFFGGTRFIPIVSFVAALVIGLTFIIIWPIIAIGIGAIGSGIGLLPFGLNSLIFGIIERALLPFGLHHVFYTPLWYTALGAQLDLSQIMLDGNAISSLPGVKDALIGGDQSIWMFLNSSPYLSFNDVYYISHHLSDGAGIGNLTWTASAVTKNYNPGEYLQGKFPIMIFGLPAAGAAMVMAAKKENRQMAFSVIGAAALTSMLTGITEPIEYTFLFLAPILFFGFHVIMAGMSFWLLNLFGAHVGLTFSGGIIDLLIYGLLPTITSNPTHFWVVLVVGIIYIPIYYFVFYFWITKKDIKTPGREDGEIKMFSKADYQEKETRKKEAKGLQKAEKLLAYLGGFENLNTIDACATRLRISVNDRELVHDDLLKELGAAGVSGKDKNLQVIFGGEADLLKSELRDMKSGKVSYDVEAVEKEYQLINNLTKEIIADEVVIVDESNDVKEVEEALEVLKELKETLETQIDQTKIEEDKKVVEEEKAEADKKVVEEEKAEADKKAAQQAKAQQQAKAEAEKKAAQQAKAQQQAKAEAEKKAAQAKAKVEADKKARKDALEKEKAKKREEAHAKAKAKAEADKKLHEEKKRQKELAKAKKAAAEKATVEKETTDQKSSPIQEKTKTKEYSKSKEVFEEQQVTISEEDKETAKLLLGFLGGKSNVKTIKSNITRISIKVENRKNVDDEKITTLDVKSIVGRANSFQLIWNGEVDSLVQALNNLLD